MNLLVNFLPNDLVTLFENMIFNPEIIIELHEQ